MRIRDRHDDGVNTAKGQQLAPISLTTIGLVFVVGVVLVAGKALTRMRTADERAVPYTTVAELEPAWGPLVAVVNVTMHERPAGADRIGFFRGRDGILWGR